MTVVGPGRCCRARAATAASVVTLALCTGCPVVSNLPAPAPVQRLREPESGRDYRLYVPEGYPADRSFPLVVTCHGTRPFDTAELQMEEWKGLAQQKGFVVVAPELIGTRGDFPPEPSEQIRRQFEDEQAILAILRAVRASTRVDQTRVFLTGWSAGGYAVLFTGLRHPEIFRALSLRQTNFDVRYVEPCVPFLDRFQAVQVIYGDVDPLKEGAMTCIQWLRDRDLEPEVLGRAGTHRRDPRPVFDFFVRVVRQRPWINVRVQDDPQDPMRVSFALRTSLEPDRYLWQFGDGQSSPVPAPSHRFERPGLYTVSVQLWSGSGKRHARSVQVQVPRIRLGTAPATGEAP